MKPLMMLLLKRFLFFVLISFITSSVCAQFKLGLSAGINLSNTRVNFDGKRKTYAYLPGFNGGLDAAYSFGNSWGLQTGIYYAHKGYRIRVVPDLDTQITHLHYFELPLQVTYKMHAVNSTSLTLGAGIYTAYGFNGRETTVGLPPFDPFSEETFKKFDIGYMLSGTYVITTNFATRIAYTHAFTTLNRPDGNLNNFLFNFSLIYWLK